MSTELAQVGTGRRRALSVAAAAAAALVVWIVAVPVLGVDLRVGGREVGPVPVLVMSVLVGLAALGLLAVLERLTRRARAVWLAVAIGVLVLSLAGPAGGDSAGAVVALVGMHLVVGAALVAGLAPTARPRTPR